jgi:acyl-CoA thioester hydrolase
VVNATLRFASNRRLVQALRRYVARLMPSPRIPIFRRERLLEAKHIDQLGHVNNLAWIRLTLELAEAHSVALGFGYEAQRALGSVWVVRHQDLHYERSAFLGERIRETTWVSELRGARCLRHTRLRSGAGELLFAANTEWAFVDLAKLRARRTPAELRAAFDLVSLEAGDAAERGS